MSLKGNLLHLGFGGHELPVWAQGVNETTLDINPNLNPDIVASMTDMGDIGKFDIVYSCHCLEHVYHHEAKQALREMYRVLEDGGTAIVIVPDLTGILPNHDVLYKSPAGPICGLDLIYGSSWMTEKNPFMGHKYGYTPEFLQFEFNEAGFKSTTSTKLHDHSVMVTGEK